MMRKKFWPLIFSRVRMAANTSAKAKVIRVTDHQQDHILHGADELGVLQQMLEVFKPHKGLVGRIGTPLIQTHAEHVEGGQDHKEEKQDGSRCHTEEYEPFAAFIRSHRGWTAPFLMVLYSPKKRRR